MTNHTSTAAERLVAAINADPENWDLHTYGYEFAEHDGQLGLHGHPATLTDGSVITYNKKAGWVAR